MGDDVDAQAWSTGHSVLVLPVPELEAYVRGRTAHHDASFLSADPAFGHAHLTVLGPFLPAPTAADLDRVAQVLGRVEPFDVELAELDAFADGTVHLRATEEAPLRALTAVLVDTFPQCPPYAGRFPDTVPHVTLDRVGPGVSVASVRRDLAGLLPVRMRADRVDLQWWANHDCHVMTSWKLGER